MNSGDIRAKLKKLRIHVELRQKVELEFIRFPTIGKSVEITVAPFYDSHKFHTLPLQTDKQSGNSAGRLRLEVIAYPPTGSPLE